MLTNENGIVSASSDELLTIWAFDPDLSRVMEFCEWVMWCRIQGVKVNG